MKNKPNPFIASNFIIESQLQNITYQLKALDGASPDHLNDLYMEIKSAMRVIDKQLAKTKSVVFSALFNYEYEPGVVQAFADNQLKHQSLGLRVQEIAKSLMNCISSSEKATTSAALIHHFNKYRLALHECLSREEVALLPLLHRYYNEKELMKMQVQLEQALVLSTPPSQSLNQSLN